MTTGRKIGTWLCIIYAAFVVVLFLDVFLSISDYGERNIGFGLLFFQCVLIPYLLNSLFNINFIPMPIIVILSLTFNGILIFWFGRLIGYLFFEKQEKQKENVHPSGPVGNSEKTR